MSEPSIKEITELFRSGLGDQAERDLIAVIKSNPSAEAFKAYVPYLLACERYDETLSAIEKFLLLTTDRKAEYAHHVLKASILNELGRSREAREILVSMASVRPSGQWLLAFRQTIKTRQEIDLFFAHAGRWMRGSNLTATRVLHHYSSLHRDFGSYEIAHFAARVRFLRMLRAVTLGQRAPQAKEISWQDDAALALRHIAEDLDAAGIKFFLISGTLLGCVRNDAVLGHDKDIDIGVDERHSTDEIRAVLKASKRFQLKHIESENCVYVRHSNGVDIDVFRHFMDAGRYMHHGVKVSWWNSPFDLENRAFLGRNYLIPSDYDKYLTENYGEWRVPVVDFETMVDTPNMEILDQDHLVWYYLIKLADYYAAGKLPQFKRVYAALQKIYELDARMRSLCEEICNGNSPLKQPKEQAPVMETPKPSRRSSWLAKIIGAGS